MERVSTIGLDLVKQAFQVHGMNKDGEKVFSHKLARAELPGFFKKHRGCVVAMEATGGLIIGRERLKGRGTRRCSYPRNTSNHSSNGINPMLLTPKQLPTPRRSQECASWPSKAPNNRQSPL